MERARMAFGHVNPSAVLLEPEASVYLLLLAALFSAAVKIYFEALVQDTTSMDLQVV